MSVNTLKPGSSGRTKDDIKDIRHVYLDIDSNGPQVLERVLSDPRLPKPNYVLSTSPGKYQVLWKVEGFTIGQAQRLNKALAKDLGADAAVHDIARVLRVPAFYNKKYPEPHQVTAQKHADSLSRPEHFHINAPEILSVSSERRPLKPPASPKSPDHSQSGKDWAYAKRKLATGHDPELVIRAIAEYRSADKHDPEAYARRTVERAQAELAAESKAEVSSEDSRSPVDR